MGTRTRLALFVVLIVGGLLAAPSRAGAPFGCDLDGNCQGIIVDEPEPAIIDEEPEPFAGISRDTGTEIVVQRLRASMLWAGDVLVRKTVNSEGEITYRASIVQLNGACDDSASCAKRLRESAAEEGCSVKPGSVKVELKQNGTGGSCEGSLTCPSGEIKEVMILCPAPITPKPHSINDNPDPVGWKIELPVKRQ